MNITKILFILTLLTYYNAFSQKSKNYLWNFGGYGLGVPALSLKYGFRDYPAKVKPWDPFFGN